MIISVTERGEFKRCRRRWDFSSYNRQSLQAIVPKAALSTGHLIHATLADWTLTPDVDPSMIFLRHANEAVTDAKKAYKAQVHMEMSDEELGSLYDAIGLAKEMITNYRARWQTPLPKRYKLVAPEQTCRVPIPETEHTCARCYGSGRIEAHKCPECGGLGKTPHWLEGTLDAIIQDDKSQLWVLERKTYGQRPRQTTLDMSDQFLAYVWLLTSLGIGPVGGIAYDGLWKREKPTKTYKLEDIFLRTLLIRPSEELEEFQRNLILEVLEMANNPPLYMNRRWEGCSDCDYAKLCVAISRDEDVEYVRNTFYTIRVKEEK